MNSQDTLSENIKNGANNYITEIQKTQLVALIEQYKEMRNEIRALYGQYFSIVFGVILIGIFITIHSAFEGKEYLFLAVPPMIIGWFSMTLIMRVNVQHIARYIAKLEADINDIVGYKAFTYETTYAKELWFSWIIKAIVGIPAFLICAVYVLSVYNAYYFLQKSNIQLFHICINRFDKAFIYISVIALIGVLALFVVLPERTFKKGK